MNNVLQQLAEILEQRKLESADKSYVASLYAKGTNTILKRLVKRPQRLSLLQKMATNNKLFMKLLTYGFTAWCY